MKRDGLSGSALAEELGVSHAAISNYLRGRIPKPEMVLRIAQFFKIPAHTFFQDILDQKSPAARLDFGDALRPYRAGESEMDEFWKAMRARLRKYPLKERRQLMTGMRNVIDLHEWRRDIEAKERKESR